MADPVTIGSMALSAGGGIMKAFGAASSGKSEAQMYEFQSGIAQFNKQIALQNRDYASAQGEEEATNVGLKGRFQEGRLRSGLAASGVDINSGSAKDVQTSQAEMTQRDMATVRNRAARVAYGYATEAEKQDLQSTMYERSAQNTRDAIPFNVAGSLISGASSVASKWSQASASGMV